MSRWTDITASFLSIFAAFAVFHSAQAGVPSTLTYQVYAGGVHVVEAKLKLDQKPPGYAASLSAHTRGFLGKLVPWRGSFATKGTAGQGSIFPREHRSVSTWKGTDDIALYMYDPRGRFKNLKLTDGGVDKTPKKIDPALTKETIDILTATLRMMNRADVQKICTGESDVFDSRRRFTLKFAAQGTEELEPSRYNFYSGPAMKCTVEVIPKGGAWKKKPRGWLSIQEQGRQKGTLPTLWLARAHPKLPPVPVRIMIKTNYGTLFMHLARID